jgi:iron complex transport system substrate-binding protein
MLPKYNTVLILILGLILIGCNQNKNSKNNLPVSNDFIVGNSYAEGFKITRSTNNILLEIHNPWPEAQKSYTYLLLTKEQAMVSTCNKDNYDGIITIPVDKIVVTSTTHIPALELLGVEQSLIGFPGTDYISSEKTRDLIENGNIRELGKNESINTEVLLEINPDLVVGYGIDGNNKTFETIKKSNIPVIFNGDWVEKSPLAKAEWIKFFGVLFDKQNEADSIFNSIEKNYKEAKILAAYVSEQPTVLCGAMHRDIWYLPSSTSSEAQILNDANVNYLWKNSEGKGSLALSFESVYEKAQEADLWLSPSYYTSFDALKNANSHYTKFKAFQDQNVYSFSNTTGETGGVTYYELGTARPDLVLKDIIKICHPELLQDYETHFFKRLQ